MSERDLKWVYRYSNPGRLRSINKDPEGFVEGLMDVPEELKRWADLPAPSTALIERRGAYLTGLILGKKLAIKNADVDISKGVENV